MIQSAIFPTFFYTQVEDGKGIRQLDSQTRDQWQYHFMDNFNRRLIVKQL